MTREEIVAELQRLARPAAVNDNPEGFEVVDPPTGDYLDGYRRGWRMALEAAIIMLRRG